MCTVPSCPTREQVSGTITRSSSSGWLSPCAAAPMPQTARAYSSTACWKPAQVPRKGMRCSRAVRTAATAPASLRYGLPGSSQIASKPSRAPGPSASSVGIQ